MTLLILYETQHLYNASEGLTADLLLITLYIASGLLREAPNSSQKEQFLSNHGTHQGAF